MMQPKRTKYRKQFKGNERWPRAARLLRSLRRLRAEGDRPRAHDGARDRGGAPRDDALREARRPGVDPRVPGRADHEEAARGPHGRGKGNVEYWVAEVQPGKVLFEMEGVHRGRSRARRSSLAAAKLSVRHAFVRAAGALMKKLKERPGQKSRAARRVQCERARWSCARNSSTCAWRRPRARLRSRTSMRKVRGNIARVKTMLGEQDRAQQRECQVMTEHRRETGAERCRRR